MESLGQIGIEFIIWLQGFRTPFLDGFFELITQLGGAGYLVLISLVAWTFDLRVGVRAMLAMITAQLFVMILKDGFHTQRPFMVDDRIWSDGEFGLSFPSGHAWGAMVYYGYLATLVRRRGFMIAMAVLIFLVGFSRVYLGVHYPHDVVAGWVFGLLMLWGWLRVEKPVSQVVQGLTFSKQVVLAFVPAIFVAAIHNIVWDNRSTLLIAGAIGGAGMALAVHEKWGFRLEESDGLRKAVRIVVGAPGILVILRLMKLTYRSEPDVTGDVIFWLWGVLLSVYIAILAPLLFEVLRLAPAHVRESARDAAF